jgi:hypothetical protein
MCISLTPFCPAEGYELDLSPRGRNNVVEIVTILSYLLHCSARFTNFHLQQEGKIYPILRDAIAVNAPDFTTLVENPTGLKNADDMYKELTFIIENTTFNITEIMVRSARKSIMIFLEHLRNFCCPQKYWYFNVKCLKD